MDISQGDVMSISGTLLFTINHTVPHFAFDRFVNHRYKTLSGVKLWGNYCSKTFGKCEWRVV